MSSSLFSLYLIFFVLKYTHSIWEKLHFVFSLNRLTSGGPSCISYFSLDLSCRERSTKSTKTTAVRTPSTPGNTETIGSLKNAVGISAVIPHFTPFKITSDRSKIRKIVFFSTPVKNCHSAFLSAFTPSHVNICSTSLLFFSTFWLDGLVSWITKKPLWIMSEWSIMLNV